ncbi:MAG: ATP-binding protein [Burkholderiaceae bacterium]
MNQLLSLARLDAVGPGQLGKSVDWSAVATQAINDTLPLLDAGGQELQVEWPPPGVLPLPLLGDETLLALMLRNLLDNAARHTPAGSRITLRFGPNSLEVEDDGPGMSAEERGRAGERFARRAGQRAEGSGIRFVHRHAGRGPARPAGGVHRSCGPGPACDWRPAGPGEIRRYDAGRGRRCLRRRRQARRPDQPVREAGGQPTDQPGEQRPTGVDRRCSRSWTICRQA